MKKQMSFEELGLAPEIVSAVKARNYTVPTPVQEKAIPHVLAGKDLLGCAQTGTGKTAAFALPILDRLRRTAQGGADHFSGRKGKGRRPRKLRALVLTPTRELANQIEESFRAYGKDTGLSQTVVYGGVGQGPQAQALRKGVDILVATPGRLLDLMSQGLVDLRAIEVFVLDEADRMLDMGFLPDIRRVIDRLPAERQTLFFSATMPENIRRLADTILRDPAQVAVAPISSAPDAVEHRLFYVEKRDKTDLLRHLLADPSIRNALVFTRTKHGADRLFRHLRGSGIVAEVIHGDKTQKAREQALGDFKRGKTRVLVATDIAARGLDIVDLSHVVNYDLPCEPEAYVHRIGRTGRAGATGIAVSFCDIGERTHLTGIERLIRRHLPVVDGHPYTSGLRPGPATVLEPGRTVAGSRYLISASELFGAASGNGARG